MKDRLTIKEFSELSGIKASTLRYWDEIGLFSPSTRDAENDYRYYSPEQIIAVNFFTVLSSLNIPLKEIKGVDANRNPESIMKLVEHQEKILDAEMRRLQECHSIIHTRREMINAGMKAAEDEISVVKMNESSFALGPLNEYKQDGSFFEPFINFCNKADDLNVNLSFPICGYCANMESFLENPGLPEHFISLDPRGKCKKEAGEYLVGFRRGYYGQFGDLPQKMMRYAEKNNLVPVGPVYEEYLLDETCVKDSTQYLVQASVAVYKR
ncbi:MerR family DNA-binding transcriptional regulator [Microgenomates group bacterium]|nr:MerR family DNA-binding transcriptional regulator [Microgenomates group bacterium]